MIGDTSRRGWGCGSCGVSGWILAVSVAFAPPLLAESEAVARNANSAPFVRGDANLDGRVTFADVFAILGALYDGAEPACPDAADADDSGALTAADVWSVLLLFLAHHDGPTGLQTPYPDFGADPTADRLGCPRDAGGVAGDGAVAGPVEAGGIDACDLILGGAELEFIHFRPSTIYVFPGQEDVDVNVLLETVVGDIEALSLSVAAEPSLLQLQSLEIGGSYIEENLTHSSWVRSHDHAIDAGCLAATLGVDIQRGVATLPETPSRRIASLTFSVAPDAAIGTETRVEFAPTPGAGGRPEIPTELVRDGHGLRHGQCPLVVRVVPRDVLFLRGDADRDGRVTISDVLTVATFLFPADPDRAAPLPCPDAADADDNGRIEFPDAVLLLRYQFLRGPPPLPPFPHWGPDDQEIVDALRCASGAGN